MEKNRQITSSSVDVSVLLPFFFKENFYLRDDNAAEDETNYSNRQAYV